eukprot:10285171-Ditylum_brightwellii.AAC.1
MNEARNTTGLYALIKRVCNLYLGEKIRKQVTFFWCYNSGDVPSDHRIGKKSFWPCQIPKFENNDSNYDSNDDLPDSPSHLREK